MTAPRKTITGVQARHWRTRLGLSATEAGDALNLSNPNVTFREYERGKAPGPPTVALMDLTMAAAIALHHIERGDLAAARRNLVEALPKTIVASVFNGTLVDALVIPGK